MVNVSRLIMIVDMQINNYLLFAQLKRLVYLCDLSSTIKFIGDCSCGLVPVSNGNRFASTCIILKLWQTTHIEWY